MTFLGGALFGIALALLVHIAVWLTKKAWAQQLPSLPSQSPRTAAQQANEAVFDELERTTPRLHPMRVQRRTARGRRRLQLEREQEDFE